MNGKRLFIDYVPGFVMGLFLPIISMLVFITTTGQTLSMQALVELHRTDPVIWLVDISPFLLSYLVASNVQQRRQLEQIAGKLKKEATEKDVRMKNEQSFFEALIKNSPFAIAQLNTDHRVIAMNPAFELLFGYREEEIIGRHLDELVVSEEYYQEATEITKAIVSGKFMKQTGLRKKKDGSLFDAEIIGIPVFSGGEKIGVLSIYNDISIQRQTEKELLLSEKRFRSLFYHSPIALLQEDFSQVKALLGDLLQQGEDVIERLKTDESLVRECIGLIKVLDVNQVAQDMFEVDSKEELQAGLGGTLTEESLNAFRNEIIALASGEYVFESEVAQEKMDGETYMYGLLRLSLAPGAEDTWDKVIISIQDITGHREAEEKLRYMSFHDALTGLYNRAYFEEEMKRLENSRQYPVTIIACDLDDLKVVNDTLGHDKGDQILRAAARVLEKAFRNEDVVARVGGDEFAVILPFVNQDVGKKICERIEHEIENYNQMAAQDDAIVPVSLSYGMISVPVEASLYEGYKEADELMYTNKEERKRRKTDRSI